MSATQTRKLIQINNPNDKDELIKDNLGDAKKRRSLRSGSQVDNEQQIPGEVNEVITRKCQVDKPSNNTTGTTNLIEDISCGNVSAILQEMEAANLVKTSL